MTKINPHLTLLPKRTENNNNADRNIQSPIGKFEARLKKPLVQDTLEVPIYTDNGTFEDFEIPESEPSFFDRLRGMLPKFEYQMYVETPDIDTAYNDAVALYDRVSQDKNQAEKIIFKAIENEYNDTILPDGTMVTFFANKGVGDMVMKEHNKANEVVRTTYFNGLTGIAHGVSTPEYYATFENDDELTTVVTVTSKPDCFKHRVREEYRYQSTFPISYVNSTYKPNGQVSTNQVYEF